MISDMGSQRREIDGPRAGFCDRCHRRVTGTLYVPSRQVEASRDALDIRAVCADCWWAIELGDFVDLHERELVLTER
jgi:hypothetical protein